MQSRVIQFSQFTLIFFGTVGYNFWAQIRAQIWCAQFCWTWLMSEFDVRNSVELGWCQNLTNVGTIPSGDLNTALAFSSWTAWFRFQLVLTRLTLFHFVTSHSFSDEALSSLYRRFSWQCAENWFELACFSYNKSWLTPFDTVS